MAHDDMRDRMEHAIRTASDRVADAPADFARRYFPEIKPNGSMRVCPFCGKKGDKFVVRRAKTGHHLIWGCYNTSCSASFDNLKSARCGDAIGLISRMEGKDRREAADRLLDITGVPNPKHNP